MSLLLVYGSSISEKTEFMYNKLITEAEKHPDRNYIALVPEQASLSVQQDLVRRHPRHALLNIDVLTFSRLIYKVQDELEEKTGEMLNETGKMMMLRTITEKRENELPVLKRNLHKEGFLSEVKSVISELAQYNVTPEVLKERLGTFDTHPLLRGKLSDVTTIYSDFLEAVHGKYELMEERLLYLSQWLTRWEAVSKTTFAFMGFTGFTPLQYECLRVLISRNAELYFEMTLGQGKSLFSQKSEDALFYMSAHMAETVKEMAIGFGASYQEEYVTEEKKVSPELRHIEKNLFSYQQEEQEIPADHIRLYRAGDRRQEVSLILHEIRENLKNGMALKDMAVIAGDPEGYREEIEAQFSDAGIPYFIDVHRDLSMNPMLQLLKNALEVLDSNFRFDETIHYCKNVIVRKVFHENLGLEDELSTYERIAEVENYARATGVRGKSRWMEPFSRKYRHFNEERLEFINDTRSALLEPLFTLSDAFKNGRVTVKERIDAIRQFLIDMKASEVMEQLSKQLYEEHDPAGQKEFEQTAEQLSEVLDQMELILGEQRLNLETFTEVLKTGIDELNIGLVPPTMDRIVIGDVKRTRLPEIRKLFIIGANEGVLPMAQKEGGILTDYDRELLLENDIVLAPTAKQEGFYTQFYLYLLLTKPKESITMTYAMADESGKALLPGVLPEELRRLFSSLEVKSVKNGFSVINTKQQGFSELAQALRKQHEEPEAEISKELAALYRFYEEQDLGEANEKLLSGVFYHYEKESLSEAVLERMFREVIEGSPSNLERYSECAYRYFLQYGLGLREPEEFTLEAKEQGTMFHDSINSFFKELRRSGKTLETISDSERKALTEKAVTETLALDKNAVIDDSQRNAYLKKRILRVTERTLLTLTEQWKAGEFTKTFSEQEYSGDTLPELTVPIDEGLTLRLRGKIDRLDTGEKGNRIYVKVIDYKSGDKKLDYTRVYYGLQLQLLLYMKAAEAITKQKYPEMEVVPSGVYYYHIDDPIVDYEEGVDPKTAILKKLQLQGVTNSDSESLGMMDQELLNAGASSTVIKSMRITKTGEADSRAQTASPEEMEMLGSFAVRKAGEIAKNITDGNIAVEPYAFGNDSGCSYCPYNSVCGFDRKISGFKERRLRKKELKDLTGETDNGNEMDR